MSVAVKKTCGSLPLFFSVINKVPFKGIFLLVSILQCSRIILDDGSLLFCLLLILLICIDDELTYGSCKAVLLNCNIFPKLDVDKNLGNPMNRLIIDNIFVRTYSSGCLFIYVNKIKNVLVIILGFRYIYIYIYVFDKICRQKVILLKVYYYYFVV